jgi:hypothetical protein
MDQAKSDLGAPNQPLTAERRAQHDTQNGFFSRPTRR